MTFQRPPPLTYISALPFEHKSTLDHWQIVDLKPDHIYKEMIINNNALYCC